MKANPFVAQQGPGLVGTAQLGMAFDAWAGFSSQERQLRQSAVLRAVIEAVPALVVVFDRHIRYQLVNRAFERWVGLPREQVIGQRAVDLFGASEYAHYEAGVARALAGETLSFERDLAVPGKGRRYLSVTFAPLLMDDGTVDGLICIAQDITEHREEQRRLIDLSRRDPLTGLLNRAGFIRYLAACCDAGEARSLAVLYVDLDRFKSVNDQHGHAAGDELLRQFAQRLQGQVRPRDAVARLGGDEFALAMTHVRERTHALAVAEKIVEAARQPFELGKAQVRIGASVGVAVDAGEARDWSGLIERADARVYVAKARGRGSWA